MKSPKPKTAEDNFREAFERLKEGVPKVLPPGTPVSQNNVSKEAGCDPTALKKSRFPDLVVEIQEYVSEHGGGARAPSERQRLLKQRQRSRNAAETNKDLKGERDIAASLLVEANALIATLTLKVRDLESRLGDRESNARILPLPPPKTKAINPGNL